jgi:hypothetical protein
MRDLVAWIEYQSLGLIRQIWTETLGLEFSVDWVNSVGWTESSRLHLGSIQSVGQNNQTFINLFLLSGLIIFFDNMLVLYKYYYKMNLRLHK